MDSGKYVNFWAQPESFWKDIGGTEHPGRESFEKDIWVPLILNTNFLLVTTIYAFQFGYLFLQVHYLSCLAVPKWKHYQQEVLVSGPNGHFLTVLNSRPKSNHERFATGLDSLGNGTFSLLQLQHLEHNCILQLLPDDLDVSH